ncbi:MAG TPA: DUF433 domain-containing protein [Gemmataceae bacterium]|nr:DUF433 domain-containing protein [Gemmataceae bacterium]
MAINDWQKVKTDKKMVLGRYIVADPKMCHGKLTFRGTRIFVADVLNQVAKGMDFESISESWGGSVSYEAVVEAVKLAREAILKHWPEMEIKDAEPDECAGRKRGLGAARVARGLADTNAKDQG